MTGNRPHAVNANFGYEIPGWRGDNRFAKQAVNGWRITGTAQLFSGAAMAPGCGFTNNPVGYPNGTPTGGVLFRCQMTDATMNGLWLPEGSTPSTVDPRLWYPINVNNFVLPKDFAPFTGRGIIGNMPPTLTYGPGTELFNFSLRKEFRFSESRRLEFVIETINALNHYNPSNPNMTITRNYVTPPRDPLDEVYFLKSPVAKSPLRPPSRPGTAGGGASGISQHPPNPGFEQVAKHDGAACENGTIQVCLRPSPTPAFHPRAFHLSH